LAVKSSKRCPFTNESALMDRWPLQLRTRARLAGQLKTFLLVAIFTTVVAVSVQAAERAPGFIQFSVQDLEGQFIPIGEVEFCLNGGQCIYADIERGFPGHFYLNAADLNPDETYTVMIYTMNVQVIYEIRDWAFVPEDYDRGWDKVLNCEKFLIYPQFHGDPQSRLSFKVDATLNPVWEERAGEGFVIEEPDPLRFPDFVFTAQANTMLGDKFKSNTDAAGGVLSVSPGWQMSGTWRHKYPSVHAWEKGWVTCRELTLTYAQTRYETMEVMTPGRVSDVLFHRVNIAYGLGRMNQAQIHHYSLAAVLSLGGIYDGSKKLQYLDRSYGLLGFGLQARYMKMFLSGGGLEVGAVIEASAIHYAADAAEDDYWFGLAPAISLGVVVF